MQTSAQVLLDFMQKTTLTDASAWVCCIFNPKTPRNDKSSVTSEIKDLDAEWRGVSWMRLWSISLLTLLYLFYDLSSDAARLLLRCFPFEKDGSAPGINRPLILDKKTSGPEKCTSVLLWEAQKPIRAGKSPQLVSHAGFKAGLFKLKVPWKFEPSSLGSIQVEERKFHFHIAAFKVKKNNRVLGEIRSSSALWSSLPVTELQHLPLNSLWVCGQAPPAITHLTSCTPLQNKTAALSPKPHIIFKQKRIRIFLFQSTYLY